MKTASEAKFRRPIKSRMKKSCKKCSMTYFSKDQILFSKQILERSDSDFEFEYEGGL